MILFWLIVAALIVIALSFVLPPLLKRTSGSERADEQERREANIAIYRDQLAELETDLRNGIVSEQQYEQDREEIERRLLEDASSSVVGKTVPSLTSEKPTLAYLLAAGLPLMAILFYLKVGDLKVISNRAAPPPQTTEASADPNGFSQQRIEANVAALAKRLESNPSDGQGWATLGRSYTSLERFAEAADAYAHATEIITNDADLWTDYAFAVAMANGRQMQGKSVELVNRALKIDPENAKALQLAGSAAFQAKDYKAAIQYWERVLSKVPAGSDLAQSVTGRINEAKSLLNQK